MEQVSAGFGMQVGRRAHIERITPWTIEKRAGKN
jgi:hypothetical protein